MNTRNIYDANDRYKVVLTRRPRTLYIGTFRSLPEAIAARDAAEASHAAHRPWDLAPRVPVRRTQQMLRMERRAAGLCQSCGLEPPKLGCVTCQGCMDAMHIKRRSRVGTAQEAASKTL